MLTQIIYDDYCPTYCPLRDTLQCRATFGEAYYWAPQDYRAFLKAFLANQALVKAFLKPKALLPGYVLPYFRSKQQLSDDSDHEEAEI